MAEPVKLFTLLLVTVSPSGLFLLLHAGVNGGEPWRPVGGSEVARSAGK